MRTLSWLETWTRRAALSTVAWCAACAGNQPTAQGPATHSAEAKQAAPRTAAESAPDYSSPAGYTHAALALLRKGDPKGGWVSPQLLKLTNSSGLQVNLERVWGNCEVDDATCAPELEHVVSEVLKVATRPSSPKATSERLFAVVRPKGYFDGLPDDVRADSLVEPLAADLMVVYVIDEGGAVRGAKRDDLAGMGLTRDGVAEAARRNLVATLPLPAGPTDCRPHTVGLWSSGNYFESSRLLLSDFWRGMAERTHRTIVAAAPAADTLIVVCDPTPEELTKLTGMVEKKAKQAARPVSNALLEWTPGGWQELKR